MTFSARVLSPALPSELLAYVLSQHKYPTTLVVCGPREEFMSALLEDVRSSRQQGIAAKHPAAAQDVTEETQWEGTEAQHGGCGHQEPAHAPATTTAAEDRANMMLSAPLNQVAVARHIRTVFVPTVSHLRAFLAVFSTADPSSRVRAPPMYGSSSGRRSKAAANVPALIAYGLVELHRDTSEWNAQGLGCTAAALVEAAHRTSMDAVIVEPRGRQDAWESDGTDAIVSAESHGRDGLRDLLDEEMSVLNVSARRMGGGSDGAGWTSRTVPVRRVLGRWFCFREGPWMRRD